jgi:NTE family protein
MTIDPARKPEELWIIQINPQEVEGTPMTVDEIADRRNELSGNLSMNQELRFIEWVNEWIEEGLLPTDRFAHTAVRRIQMDERFHFTTKLDRRPEFIGRLMDMGEARAERFLAEELAPA